MHTFGNELGYFEHSIIVYPNYIHHLKVTMTLHMKSLFHSCLAPQEIITIFELHCMSSWTCLIIYKTLTCNKLVLYAMARGWTYLNRSFDGH